MDKNLNLKVNVNVTKSLFFSKMEKAGISHLILLSTVEDDKKISDLVIKDNEFSIDRRTKMHQENKSEGQIHTIYILPKCRKTGNFN